MTRASRWQRAVRRMCLGAALGLSSAQGAQAQVPAAPTLADIFARLRAGEELVGFAAASPLLDRRIAALESYFRRANAIDWTLDQLTDVYTHRRADLPTVARWDRRCARSASSRSPPARPTTRSFPPPA